MPIANEIREQIGHKAFYMIGAKNLCDVGNGLGFKVMKNAKGVNYIEIKLNGKDLYDAKYMSIRGSKVKVLSEDNDIYCDMLRGSIERNTELYTKLF